MSLVEQQQCVVVAGKVVQVGEGSEVAIHTEDTVAQDQSTPGVRAFAAEQFGEVVGVAVVKDVDARPRQSAAIDQAGVVQLVAEDGILAAGEGGDEGKV